MDYVVGSIAALISGNVTPNRPKLIRRALTPTKHPASPNVTPKSEFVEDRSIFLSPTQQKKKAIVKKSPKRIFENPDLDITENNDSISPKADKVKKHLKDELEANEMGKSSILSKKSPSNKLEKPVQTVSPNKKSKTKEPQVTNESTPKKKKRKSELEVIDDTKTEEIEVDQAAIAAVDGKKDSKNTKKMQRRKSVADVDNSPDILTEDIDDTTNKLNPTILQTEINQDGKKKKNKKHKKNKQANTGTVENQNGNKENKLTTEGTMTEENNTTEAKSPKQKKCKNKNKDKIEAKKTQSEVELDETEAEQKKQSSNNDEMDQVDESDEEISNIANPNAITEKDTDSEHDSDDEIDSENEDEEVLKNDDAEESSDDESEAKTKKGAKQKKNKAALKTDAEDTKEDAAEREDDTEVIKRTLFVGNVPFSGKCKKDIKRIFSQYGEIETVRIRTVPVKDARVTPKLAVIKNEIHPDRSTVNVYVKFADPDSVERALAENNTVLNHHHLRVTRSGSTGVEHDPNSAVFVGNLPFAIEDETLRAKFEKCGQIESVRIVRDKKTNAGKGFGYVNFASKDGVELALELTEEDLTIKNRIIRVKRCTRTKKRPNQGNQSIKQTPRKDFGNRPGQNRNFGNNQGQNRNFGNRPGQTNNFGNNQRNFGSNQRNFGSNQNRSNQGPRSFGNNQGQNRNVGNNQGQNRNFGNNQGQNRNFNSNQGSRNFGNKFGNQGNEADGASRRIMNKRPHQESGDGPPTKKQHLNEPPREKKQKKEFVGMTAEKKKKQKVNKGQKKKKAISEIMTK